MFLPFHPVGTERGVRVGDEGADADHVEVPFLKVFDISGQRFQALSGESHHVAATHLITQLPEDALAR